jgi:6-pyruvoyltetrahydropterin/6-carboxytetrahydropterin synthase
MQIRKHFRFEAAHALPYHPGKCARLHGHSYGLEVAVREHAVDVLDHQNLNDMIENPTAEQIAMWIWRRLEEQFSGLDEIVLWETPTSCAVIRRSDFGPI